MKKTQPSRHNISHFQDFVHIDHYSSISLFYACLLSPLPSSFPYLFQSWILSVSFLKRNWKRKHHLAAMMFFFLSVFLNIFYPFMPFLHFEFSFRPLFPFADSISQESSLSHLLFLTCFPSPSVYLFPPSLISFTFIRYILVWYSNHTFFSH